MNRDELIEIFGGGRVEILKTLKERDRFLLNTDTGEICRLLGEIVRNPGTIRIELDGPQRRSSMASPSTGSRSAMTTVASTTTTSQ
jgi:hypothetical protein